MSRKIPFLAAFTASIRDLERERIRLGASLLMSVAYWLLVGLTAWIVVVAIDFSISWMTATLVIMGTIFFATAVPAAPSAVGTFEFAIVYVLEFFGVDRETGFGFAVITHAIFFLPPTIIAAMFLPREGVLSVDRIRGLVAPGAGGPGATQRASLLNVALFSSMLIIVGFLIGACSDSSAPSPIADSPTTVVLTATPGVASPQPAATTPPTSGPRPTATAPAAPPTPGRPLLTTPEPTRAAPTPVIEGKHGGILNLAARADIAHQDVHQEASPALSTWGPGIVYSRLMRFKSGPDIELPSLAVECELCESWGMAETGTAFIFRLRSDVRWQNILPVNGRALTSDDIVFSYDRQRQEGWPNAPILHMVEELVAPQPDILRISLLAPDADFFASLADGRSKIVPGEVVRLRGDLKTGPTIGSGPWILTETRPDVSHTFESNPDYFERPYPFVDKLKIHVITDAATRDAAFRVGALDVQQMDPQEWEQFRRQNPGAPFLMVREPGTGLEVALNTSVSPFDDARVRRAVFQAMDPWQAVQDIWLGAAFVSLGLPPAEADWLLADDELKGFLGDPDLARELLRDYGLGLPILVSIKVGDFGETYRAHAARIADEMRAVGFAPTLQLMNRRQFGDEVWLGGDYQMFVGPIAPVTTPNGYLLPVLHSQGRWNTTGHSDAELDRLIEAQAVELDPAARRDLSKEIQRSALEGAYRFMPATGASVWAWWPRVQNFHPNFAGFEYAHWARVWVSE